MQLQLQLFQHLLCISAQSYALLVSPAECDSLHDGFGRPYCSSLLFAMPKCNNSLTNVLLS